MAEPILFQPIYQERVWGGRRLASSLGRSLPGPGPIGESWEVVDRPEAQSIIRSGPYNGLTLREALKRVGGELMGPRFRSGQPFPILVKWLDCRERLSLQVHPPASAAPELGGEPKTENWFIAEAEREAALIVGLRRGVTRQRFEEAIRDQSVESCVHRFPVEAGQSILVRSGQVHAIDAGSLILEIQQNSDTTYRVYDWGRVGLDGKPRQLHVRESLASIDFNDFEPQPLPVASATRILAECPEFRIRQEVLGSGRQVEVGSGEEPQLLHVVEGRLRVGSALLARGDNVLLPFGERLRCTAEQDRAVFLITDRFL